MLAPFLSLPNFYLNDFMPMLGCHDATQNDILSSKFTIASFSVTRCYYPIQLKTYTRIILVYVVKYKPFPLFIWIL